MIEIIEGKLGAGKSYFAIERFLGYWSRGETVITNVPVNWDACKKYLRDVEGIEVADDQYVKLQDKDIPELHKVIPFGTKNCHTRVWVDEAHVWFNSRAWAETMKRSRELLDWLTHSRHYFVDVAFISQSAKNIDAQFGRLAQWVIRSRDLSLFTVAACIGHILPMPPYFLRTYIDYLTNDPIKREFARKNPALYPLYDSFCEVSGVEKDRVKDRVVVKKVAKQKGPMFRWIVVFGVFVCLVMFAIKAFAGGVLGKSVAKTDKPSFVDHGRPAISKVVPAASIPAASQAQQTQVTEISSERVTLWIEGLEMWTDVDQYRLGRLCARGRVVALRDREAKIQSLNGSIFFVRGIDKPGPKTPGTAPVKTPEQRGYSKGEILIAEEPQAYKFQTPPLFPKLGGPMSSGRSVATRDQ